VNPFSSILHFFGGRARGRHGSGAYLALGSTAFRVFRRIFSTKQRTLLRFEVKPGEVYELRGVRRGR
jgi:hypothetical protein